MTLMEKKFLTTLKYIEKKNQKIVYYFSENRKRKL